MPLAYSSCFCLRDTGGSPYHPLPMATTSDAADLSLLTEEPIHIDKRHSLRDFILKNNQGVLRTIFSSKLTLSLALYSLITSLLLVLLLVTLGPKPSSESITYTLTKFGTNRRYQSLDHKYDALWNTMYSDDSGYIEVENEGREGIGSHGSISM